MSIEISPQRLRELLNYEADTGHFTWKHPPRGRVAKMKYHDFCPVPRSSAGINISRRQAGG